MCSATAALEVPVVLVPVAAAVQLLQFVEHHKRWVKKNEQWCVSAHALLIGQDWVIDCNWDVLTPTALHKQAPVWVHFGFGQNLKVEGDLLDDHNWMRNCHSLKSI
jgi:hypothetical protein